MKKTLITIMAVFGMMLMAGGLMAQQPPHPNGGSNPTGSNTPVGGGAPIDGGLTIMLMLGAAYGGKKALQNKKSNN